MIKIFWYVGVKVGKQEKFNKHLQNVPQKFPFMNRQIVK